MTIDDFLIDGIQHDVTELLKSAVVQGSLGEIY